MKFENALSMLIINRSLYITGNTSLRIYYAISN